MHKSKRGYTETLGGIWFTPFLVNVEKSGERELEGSFKISGKGVNLWVRVYSTNYGKRARVTVSYFDGSQWKNTPALWIDKKLYTQLSEHLKKLADNLT